MDLIRQALDLLTHPSVAVVYLYVVVPMVVFVAMQSLKAAIPPVLKRRLTGIENGAISMVLCWLLVQVAGRAIYDLPVAQVHGHAIILALLYPGLIKLLFAVAEARFPALYGKLKADRRKADTLTPHRRRKGE